MPCVSDNELAALVDGTLDPANRATAIAELTSCASCRGLLHEALGLRASGPVAVPAELAGYELGRVLGAGSGGIVVRARDPVLARDVALKLVRATPATHALREARTLATVRHPAVVGVYATGTAADVDYVAMELVDGESLAARLARGPLPWREALRWFADVAAGLGAIHAAGLVHRDVKPGNLLVDGDRLRIADFGLAVRDPDAALAGTLPYMAPEVLGGAAADARSDLYSLFASLFETLTGARPYRELDRRALRAAAMHGSPVWARVPRVPARVRAVVERGLAFDPAARFQDATAARAALLAARRVSTRTRALAAASAVFVIAATAIAAASVIRDADACAAAPPSWMAAAATASPARVPVLARARLLQYGDALASAIAGACRDDTPTGTARRACLAAADRRAGALVADPGDSAVAVVALQRAVVALPDPTACSGWHHAPPWSPLDDVALAAARDAVAAGDVRGAARWIALVAPSSSDAGDAELVRGSLALAAADTERAVAAFRSALDASATLGRDDLAIAANTGLAAAVGENQHQPAAGEAYAAAALAIARRTGDPRSIGTAQRYVGWLAHVAGDDARAVRELTAALETLTTAGATMEQSIAELELGKIARAHGDYAGARAHVERAGVLRRTLLGPTHPDTIAIDADRASIDLVDGHAAHAVALQRGIVARLAAIYGDTHPALAGPLTNLGAALASSGDFTAAGDVLARALAIDRARFGELDAQVADDYANLAGMRMVAGRYRDAADLYRAAIAAARSALGDGHPLLARPYAQLAIALVNLSDSPAATDALEHAIAIYRDHPGHDDELARALATRATLETAIPRGKEALRDALEAVAILERAHGADHVALLPALSALAQADYTVGDFAGSAAAAERSLAIRARVGGAPRQTAETHLILARALWKLGRHSEALTIGRQGLAELGADDPALVARARAWLAHPT